MHIDWTPPQPRSGLAGAWDAFIGPGARDAELWLQLLAALAAPLLLLLYARQQALGWSAWQLAIAAVLALDLAGGVVTNATAAAKRWYHRPGQGFGAHLRFVAVHFVHPLLVAWLFRGGDWLYFGVSYLYLLLAAVAILRTPLYLQRPFAMAIYLGGLLLSLYVFSPTPGLEWFLPVFYLKLLVSHLLMEAPFAAAQPDA